MCVQKHVLAEPYASPENRAFVNLRATCAGDNVALRKGTRDECRAVQYRGHLHHLKLYVLRLLETGCGL